MVVMEVVVAFASKSRRTPTGINHLNGCVNVTVVTWSSDVLAGPHGFSTADVNELPLMDIPTTPTAEFAAIVATCAEVIRNAAARAASRLAEVRLT